MPWKRRLSRPNKTSQRTRRRNSTKSRQRTSRALAAQVRAVARAQLETKICVQEVNEQKITIGNDQWFGFMNCLSPGDAPDQYAGKQVSPVSFRWRGYMRPVGAWIRGNNGVVASNENNDFWAPSGDTVRTSDVFQQQYYARVIVCHQQPNVRMSATNTSECLPVQTSDSRLYLGNGGLADGKSGDYKDILRDINWAVTKPFYDKTFFFNGDPYGNQTHPIDVKYTYPMRKKINYPTGLDDAAKNPDSDGIVMYVITRYANDDYPSFLQALLPDGVTAITGGLNGAAPDLEICGESTFRFKDA